MNLKRFYEIVVLKDWKLKDLNQELKDIEIKIRLIDKEGNKIKDYSFESSVYFEDKDELFYNKYFVIEIKEYENEIN